jgi:hypothetical protein
MTQKVHGFAKTPDQFLSGGLPMFTATVASGGLTTLVGDEEQHSVKMDKLIEAISIRAQPVVMGTPSATVLNFAVEHNEIFGDLTAFSNEVTAACGFAVVISAFTF